MSPRQTAVCGRAFLRALCLVPALWIALPASLAAHAFWPNYYSAKSSLSLDADGLQAVVIVEVPTFEMVSGFREYFSDIDLMAEIEAGRFEPLEEEFRQVQFDRFSAGLALSVGGVEAAGEWRPVDSPVNGKGSEGFFVYMLEFAFTEPPRLGSRPEARLRNTLLEESSVMLANVAEAGDGWEVVESSIPAPEEYPDLPEGAVAAAELGLWTEEPVKRDLRVVFGRPRP